MNYDDPRIEKFKNMTLGEMFDSVFDSRKKEREEAIRRCAELEEENRKLRDALQWIAQQPHDKRYGSRRCTETDLCITEYCLPCYAKATLSALRPRRRGGGDKAK